MHDRFFTVLGQLEHAETTPEDDELFVKALTDAVLSLDLSAYAISSRFGISIVSVRRWFKRKNLPGSGVRLEVLGWLVSLLCTRHNRPRGR